MQQRIFTYATSRPRKKPSPQTVSLRLQLAILVLSGPGYPTEPNLRMFLSLIQNATRRISITSPYFIPDEALLSAMTTAAYRGVEVELFVGLESDHLIVNHAQRSYYSALLIANSSMLVLLRMISPACLRRAMTVTS